MSFFGRFFKKKKIECPRCLGKGQVDWDDIKRLRKELYWVPGSCAYCDSKGKIDVGFQDKVDVDTTYLVNNLTANERANLLDKDVFVIGKAMKFVKDTDKFIEIVEELHFKIGFDSYKIADYFLSEQKMVDESKRIDLIEYIEKVIEIKKERI